MSLASDTIAGRLVSVNVGLPKDVSWNGRTVHTGVWKRPVDGRRMVRSLNIDGDGQGDLGGHGGPHRAVLVYQLDAYDHWREVLGRDDLEPGAFGENFTIDGLPDGEVCIGDRFRIGEALFEVSQPRVTCYRVGLRLGEPRLPSLLVAHRRPGFYLRVLQEGTVAAGDLLIRAGSGPERMSVAEVDALLYLPGHDREAIARALRITALSPGWQGSFTSMLAAAPGATGNVGLTDAAAAPPVAWPGFRPVRVLSIVEESEEVRSLRLGSVDGDPLPTAAAGQFVALRLPGRDGAPSTTRSYSLSGPVGRPDYRVSVKLEAGGVASALVHGLRTGARIEMAAPRGTFILRDGDGPVFLVSAGIGATPVLAMLHALAAKRTTREVWWLHGARNGRTHPFATEVRMLLNGLSRVHSEVWYSAPLPGDRVDVDFTRTGRLDADALRGLHLPTDADAYVCGPASFMQGTRQALTDVGLEPTRIATEVFGATAPINPGIVAADAVPPHAPVGPPGLGPEIAFARSGLRVPWRDGSTSLLELAEACDVPTRWSCRTGICHTCETGLLSGSVGYDPPPIDPPAAGNVLICCALPREPVVLDL